MRIHKRCLECATWYKVPVYSRRFGSKFCSLSCTTTYRNKNDNPAKSKAVRLKIAAKARCRDLSHLRSPESIEKQRQTISGENHWNWQGGKTGKDRKLRNSIECKRWRKSVFERDNYTCKGCGIRGGYLEADHIMPWSKYPELRFKVSNGRTLCKCCHRKTNTFGGRLNKPINKERL